MQNQPCQKINHVYQGFLNTAEGNSILWPIYCSEHKISARLCRTSSEMEHWSAILWNNTFRLYRGCTILPRCYSPYIICCNSKPHPFFLMFTLVFDASSWSHFLTCMKLRMLIFKIDAGQTLLSKLNQNHLTLLK